MASVLLLEWRGATSQRGDDEIEAIVKQIIRFISISFHQEGLFD